MELEKLYFLSQIGASCLIFLSLIFLALQMRQNTKALQSASMDAWARSHMTFAEDIYRSRDIAEIMMKSDERFGELDEVDKYRSVFIAYRNQISAVRLFHARQSGLVADKEWDEMRKRWIAIGRRENAKVAWRLMSTLYGEDARRYFEAFFGDATVVPQG